MYLDSPWHMSYRMCSIVCFVDICVIFCHHYFYNYLVKKTPDAYPVVFLCGNSVLSYTRYIYLVSFDSVALALVFCVMYCRSFDLRVLMTAFGMLIKVL